MCLLCAFLAGCGPGSWPGGVHARFGWNPERVRVASVRSDGPAARAGLREDDLLLAIDGVPVAGLSERDVHDRLAGEVGTTVVLTVERDGKPLELSVQRAPYGPRD